MPNLPGMVALSLFLNGCRISGYFDTKFTAVAQIEPTLQKFEDLKIVKFFNPEEVYFLMTHVICATPALGLTNPDCTKVSLTRHLRYAMVKGTGMHTCAMYPRGYGKV